MKTFRLRNKHKKSFLETETYTKNVGGETYTLTIEIGWRFGWIDIEVPIAHTKEMVESSIGKVYNKDGGVLNIDDIPFEWSVSECFDSHSLEYEFPDSDRVPENIQEQLETYLEENGHLSLGEIGWDYWEGKYTIENAFILEAGA